MATPELALADPTATADTIASFIRAQLDGAGRSHAVVALSGGVDSALAAALSVRAVGSARVIAHTLPDGRVPSDDDLRHAHDLAEAFDLSCRTIGIEPALAGLEEALRSPSIEGDRVAWGNVKARLRMIVNYFVAETSDGLVVGTGNRSEALLGYATKYGDAGVDILPIGGLYKTQVRQLARHLGVPEAIVDKPPSAGLWEGQTDEAELGLAYETLDRILVRLQDRGMDVAAAADDLDVDPATVQDVADRIAASRHKRRMPPMPDLAMPASAADPSP